MKNVSPISKVISSPSLPNNNILLNAFTSDEQVERPQPQKTI
jgi:hypothetical protein